MRQEKFHRSRNLVGAICIGALALGSSTVSALPKDGGGGNPDDSGGGSSDPVQRPPRTPRKPQIPGYVLLNGEYYRETTLPLCEWGSGERSYFDQFIRQDGEQKYHWTCLGGGIPNYDPHRGYLNDTCTFSGPPANRPNDATYTIRAFDYWENWYSDLEWPDGSAFYGSWYIQCARAAATDLTVDTVVKSTFEGKSWDGSECQLPTKMTRPTVVAELVGGDVEHVRPARVRAQANIGYHAYEGPRNIPGDLVLAIQVFGASGWEDFATVTRTTGPTPALQEIEATVPEGSFVRVQVRGTQRCNYQYEDGYDIRNLRIQVETCIPDQSNPGSCL